MSLTQLRIGMIGVNGRGGLWRHWHDPKGRSVVVGGADIVPEYLAAFRQENGGNPFITEDYRELIARHRRDRRHLARLLPRGTCCRRAEGR